MSKEERRIADLTFSATVNLEKARTVLLVTSEHFRLNEADMSKEDRQMVGFSVEAIGTLLNIADDYIRHTVDALEKDGAENEQAGHSKEYSRGLVKQ